MDNDRAKCPSCGAPVFIRNNMDHGICEYCGATIFASEVAINKQKHDAQLELELKRINKYIKIHAILFSVFLVLCLGGFVAGFLYRPEFAAIGLLASLMSMIALMMLVESIKKRDKLEKQKLS